MLCVDEGTDASRRLSACDGVKGHRRLAAGLGSVDLHDAPTREATNAKGQVQRNRPGRDHVDGRATIFAKAHDCALAELALDVGEGSI